MVEYNDSENKLRAKRVMILSVALICTALVGNYLPKRVPHRRILLLFFISVLTRSYSKLLSERAVEGAQGVEANDVAYFGD